jgi:hypothetical protein
MNIFENIANITFLRNSSKTFLETSSETPSKNFSEETSIVAIADRGRQVDLKFPGTVLYVDVSGTNGIDRFFEICPGKYTVNGYFQMFYNFSKEGTLKKLYEKHLYNNFDIVIDFWDILEGIDMDGFDFCFRLLKPNGFIIIENAYYYLFHEITRELIEKYTCVLFFFESPDKYWEEDIDKKDEFGDTLVDYSTMYQRQKIIISTNMPITIFKNVSENNGILITTHLLEEIVKNPGIFNLNKHKPGKYCMKISRTKI